MLEQSLVGRDKEIQIDPASQKLMEGNHRRLGYAKEFRRMLREHPRILKTAIQLTQKAEDEYTSLNVQVGRFEVQWNKDETRFDIIKLDGKEQESQPYSLGRGVLLAPGKTLKDEENGLEVTVLGKINVSRPGKTRNISTYLKMKLGDQVFFVKKSVATNNPGYREFKNSGRVRAALHDLENLGVVEAQMGYDDDHQSWFVSKWHDLESEGFSSFGTWAFTEVNDYGVTVHPVKNSEEHFLLSDDPIAIGNKIVKMIYRIEASLRAVGIEIHDLTWNLFYNPKTDKFFLLDVTSQNSRRYHWMKGQSKL